MKKNLTKGLAVTCVAAMLIGCGNTADTQTKKESETIVETSKQETETIEAEQTAVYENATQISLSDDGIFVDGEAISENEEDAVYAARDIVFYLEDQGITYGAGSEADEHSQEEADAHQVVHITQPGTYVLSGNLSAGQIAVDLGDEAKKDPEAVVTLVLNGVDIQCSVAPAVMFYRVYECGSDDAENAVKDVDTSAAGANVIIADGTVNNVTGSYVARIYKSYELNEAGTEVVSNKKLHKYDGAFYSKMSMNIDGETLGNGVLNITADNEGLDTELHLTLNGGIINIWAGNDGINTNEDEVSVTTINGGVLNICVTGETGEGDGVDSNGWIVINGGEVISQACSNSMDAGIDSDMGIYINGGSVIATGNMYDHIDDSEQNFVVFQFASRQKGGSEYILKNEAGEAVMEYTPENDFEYLIYSSEKLTEGTYTLWNGDVQLAASKSENMGMMPGGFGGMTPPEGFEMPEGMQKPEDMTPPEEIEMPEGMQKPEGLELPEGMQKPEGMTPPQGEGKMEMPQGMDGVNQSEADKMDKGFVIPEGTTTPEGQMPGKGGFHMENAEVSSEFVIEAGANFFTFVTTAE